MIPNFVSDKIRKKTASRLAAVQAVYMAALSDLSVDEIVGEFRRGEIGRLVIEEDETETEHFVELGRMDNMYFEEIVRGVLSKKEDLEASIRQYLKGGTSFEMQPMTMQALLLCAVYELGYSYEVDARVLIQEYVDLAYAFFSKNEPKMVNALLDQIARELRE